MQKGHGGVMVELIALGKPVASYVRREVSRFVLDAMWAKIPITRLYKRTLDGDFVGILTRHDQWMPAGLRSRTYVEDWHDPIKIARPLKTFYCNPHARLALGV